VPGLETVVGNRADADTPELHDRVANRVAHLADLPVAPLVYHERQDALRPRLRLVDPAEPHFGGRGPATVDRDAAREPVERVPIRHPSHADFVLARNAVTRMREARRQFAIAREDQETLRIVVEPPHRIDVIPHAPACQEIDDRRPMLRIRPARDVAPRLVEEDVACALRLREPPAVDLDLVDAGLGFRPELGHRPAVDGHTPLRDERFGRPA